MNIVDIIESENLKENVPEFNIGDTVKVFVKIKEGDKQRIQAYEGVVISRKNGSVRETFTVRRISYGVGVERTFPLHSPLIDHVEVTRKGKARRAKLFYLRDRLGKSAKTKEKVGARIETNEITIKEDIVEEAPVAEETAEVPAEETTTEVKE